MLWVIDSQEEYDLNIQRLFGEQKGLNRLLAIKEVYVIFS